MRSSVSMTMSFVSGRSFRWLWVFSSRPLLIPNAAVAGFSREMSTESALILFSLPCKRGQLSSRARYRTSHCPEENSRSLPPAATFTQRSRDSRDFPILPLPARMKRHAGRHLFHGEPQRLALMRHERAAVDGAEGFRRGLIGVFVH
jgi:hypothetical protein